LPAFQFFYALGSSFHHHFERLQTLNCVKNTDLDTIFIDSLPLSFFDLSRVLSFIRCLERSVAFPSMLVELVDFNGDSRTLGRRSIVNDRDRIAPPNTATWESNRGTESIPVSYRLVKRSSGCVWFRYSNIVVYQLELCVDAKTSVGRPPSISLIKLKPWLPRFAGRLL
jgi:hypothetical protein